MQYQVVMEEKEFHCELIFMNCFRSTCSSKR